jgi:hypothetical protein
MSSAVLNETRVKPEQLAATVPTSKMMQLRAAIHERIPPMLKRR